MIAGDSGTSWRWCAWKPVLIVLLWCASTALFAQGIDARRERVVALIERSKELIGADSVSMALRTADSALVLAQDERALLAVAELQAAKVYSELGAYDKSLEHGLAAMRAADGAMDRTTYFDALNSVGLSHFRMRHMIDARAAFERVLAELGADGDRRLRAFALNNLGMLEHSEGNPQQALAHYRSSLVLKEALADTAGIVRTLNNIGTVHSSLGLADSALVFYRRSLRLKRIVHDRPGIASTLGNIGEVFGSVGQLDSARSYLEQAKAIADSLELPAVQVNILHNLAELYKALGDLPRALETKEAYVAMNARLLNEQYNRRVADLQVGYDLEQKNAAIAALEKDAEVRRNRLVLLVALAVALMVSVVLLVIAVRARARTLRHKQEAFRKQQEIDALRIQAGEQENTRLGAEVEHKARELASMATQAFQKNQLLSGLLEKLDAEERKPHDPASLIRTLRKSIKENIDLDADWEQFKLHFAEVHPRFFEALLQRSPGLGQTDMRHCAYIRLDLNTKEIARLLNIAPSSVQIARVRLKKKLDLERDEDLKDFIRSIGS